MGKRYVMFVDERGFLNSDRNKNMTMVGVIFEYDYCSNLKYNICELRTKINEYNKKIFGDNNVNVPLDDIILKENVYKNIDKTLRNRFINELPSLFKGLKFTIITSMVKHDKNRVNDSYSLLSKKLLKKFYSFLVRKNGESGGIIIEAREDATNHIMQQNFFDVYNERNINFSIFSDIQNKINSFIICEKSNEVYSLGIEVLNILNNIIYRVSNGYREVDNKLVSYLEYGNKNKIFNEIKHKIYNDLEIGISSKHLQKNSYNNIGIINKELIALKEQLKLKEVRIVEKEKEINDLSNKIKVLNKKLEEVLYNQKNDNIITKILLDIDSKMKGFDNVTAVTTGAKS